METILIQAFLCQDQMSAQVSLTRSSTIERMVRTTMNLMHTRLNEARMEPSRCLQRIFNRRRRHLFDLKLYGCLIFSFLSINNFDFDF